MTKDPAKRASTRDLLPFLAAVATLVVVLGAAALASAGTRAAPPPQPPFAYPSPGEGIGVFSRPVGNCSNDVVPIGLAEPRHPGLLASASLAYAPFDAHERPNAAQARPRMLLARRLAQFAPWRDLINGTDPVYGVRAALWHIDFRRCSVLAVFVPGNIDAGWLGVRLNDRRTLTMGLYRQPHVTGEVCGSTSGTGFPVGTTCFDSPPIDGFELFIGLSAKKVAHVQRVFAITQPPPPPPPPNSTTGSTAGVLDVGR